MIGCHSCHPKARRGGPREIAGCSRRRASMTMMRERHGATCIVDGKRRSPGSTRGPFTPSTFPSAGQWTLDQVQGTQSVCHPSGSWDRRRKGLCLLEKKTGTCPQDDNETHPPVGVGRGFASGIGVNRAHRGEKQISATMQAKALCWTRSHGGQASGRARPRPGRQEAWSAGRATGNHGFRQRGGPSRRRGSAVSGIG